MAAIVHGETKRSGHMEVKSSEETKSKARAENISDKMIALKGVIHPRDCRCGKCQLPKPYFWKSKPCWQAWLAHRSEQCQLRSMVQSLSEVGGVVYDANLPRAANQRVDIKSVAWKVDDECRVWFGEKWNDGILLELPGTRSTSVGKPNTVLVKLLNVYAHKPLELLDTYAHEPLVVRINMNAVYPSVGDYVTKFF